MATASNITHQQQRLADHASWAAIGLALGLMIIKIIGGVFGHSEALVADGLHSGADLLTNVLVLVATRFGRADPDDDHPYGHQRIETAATVALAIFLALTGLAILINSAGHLLLHHAATEAPQGILIIIILLALGSNEMLFHYTLAIAKRIGSELLRANAWHARSDAITSLIVLISLIVAHYGYPQFDLYAAFLVGLFIIKMGWSLGYQSVRELIDTGVPATMLEKITHTIRLVPGVKSIHELRTRYMANRIFIDVHVLVDSLISVSEGHYIGDQVIIHLYQTDLLIGDVIVHIDPENDETAHLNTSLPSRQGVMSLLKNHSQSLLGFAQLSELRLHYIEGKLLIELYFPEQLMAQYSNIDLCQSYQTAFAQDSFKVKVYFGSQYD